MDADNNNNSLPWYLRGSLKDWSIIVGGIGLFYMTTVSSNASIKEALAKVAERQEAADKKSSEIISNQKESDKATVLLLKEMDLRLNKIQLEVEILKVELKNKQ